MSFSLIKAVNTTNASKKKARRERDRGKTGAFSTLQRVTGSRTPNSLLITTNLALNSVVDKSSSKKVVRGSLTRTPHLTSTATMAEKIGFLVATAFRYSNDEEEKLII